jgi:hypothetical protein
MIKMKQHMRATILASLIFIALLSSACTNSGGSGPERIYVGTKGLTVEYFTSNPKTIFEKDHFSIALFIKNEGAYSINSSNPGLYAITYDDYYLSLDGDKSKPIIIEGKSLTNPMGDNDHYEFLFDAKSLNKLRESVKTRINLNLCYPYRTEMSTAVCVDTRINTQDQGPTACKIQTYSGSEGQGAPVAVTKVESEMLIYDKNSVRPQYKIHVENRGKGYVINRNACRTLNFTRVSTDLRKVTVRAYLSNEELQCSPKELKLQDNPNNFVRCSVTDENIGDYSRTNRNYVAPLTIILDYAYAEAIPYDIEIKKRDEVTEPDQIICGYYEILVDGECVSKCDFCAKNPGDSRCRNPAGVPSTFQWGSGFSCSCTKTKCEELRPTGDCVPGFCTGTDYCCRTNECKNVPDGNPCGDNHVCIGDTCSSREICEFEMGNMTFNDVENKTYGCRLIGTCIEDSIVYNKCSGGVDRVCCVAR